MLARPTIMAGAVETLFNRGDIMNLMETIVIDTTATALTYTGLHVASGILQRSGTDVVSDTLPSAAALILAVQGQMNQLAGNQLPGAALIPLIQAFPQWATMGLERNSTMRFIVRNLNAANVITLVAPASAGVVLSGSGALAAVSVVEWLVTFLSTAMPTAFIGDPVNASPNINNVAAVDLDRLDLGMSLYGAASGTAAVIAAIDYANNRVVASVNNTAGATAQNTPATPTTRWTRLRSSTV